MRANIMPGVIVALFTCAVFGQPPAQDVDRTYHFAPADTTRAMQEMAVVIRSTGDIRNLTIDTAQGTLSLHATAAQAELADWLFNELDKPANLPPQQTSGLATIEYRVAGSNDDIVRVFYLTHPETLQSFMEVATLTRSIADIRRLFTYNEPKAIVMRGTPDQAELARWLLSELDRPLNAADAAIHEFHMTGTPENVVRIFYLSHSVTVQRFQEIATYVRSTTQIRRAFTCNAPRAIAMRGTAAQIAQAEQLIRQQDKAQQ